jgi:hypothetical protein
VAEKGKIPEGVARLWSESMYVVEDSSSHFRRHNKETLGFEPGNYLELIPWHELTLITVSEYISPHFPSGFLSKDIDEKFMYSQ